MLEGNYWEKKWVVVVSSGEAFQQNLPSKPVGPVEIFWQFFLINLVKCFIEATFCGSLWKPWTESPSRWRWFVVPRAGNISYYINRWTLHRVCIWNQPELIPWVETVLLGFETEICERSWLRKLHCQRIEKKPGEVEAMEEGEDAPVLFATLANNILH